MKNKETLEEANSRAEESYTNKVVRNWWVAKTETERRVMVRAYFSEGNSENVDTLYGIMPEEIEEIYNINIEKESEQEIKSNNPNAFPLEYEEYNSVGLLCKRQDFGMTLRDYYAAAALTGLCAHSGTMNLVNVQSTVARSYEVANEMLKQRETYN